MNIEQEDNLIKISSARPVRCSALAGYLGCWGCWGSPRDACHSKGGRIVNLHWARSVTLLRSTFTSMCVQVLFLRSEPFRAHEMVTPPQAMNVGFLCLGHDATLHWKRWAIKQIGRDKDGGHTTMSVYGALCQDQDQEQGNSNKYLANTGLVGEGRPASRTAKVLGACFIK